MLEKLKNQMDGIVSDSDIPSMVSDYESPGEEEEEDAVIAPAEENQYGEDVSFDYGEEGEGEE
jgi:hypothetical protein